MGRLTSGMLALSAALAGCHGGGARTYITRFPRWDFQSYRRIAVLPLQADEPQAAEAARAATDALTDLLAGNGAFTILSRAELAEVLTEQDLSRLAEVADPRTALPEGRLLGAQALVIGKIRDCDLQRQRKQVRVNRYARDRKGRIIRDRYGRPRVVGQDIIPIFYHRARVGGTVRVIDAATGRLLLSHTVPPIQVEQKQAGGPPQATPEQLALRAAEELALDAYQHIAPIRARIRLKKDMLAIALSYYEGRYETTSKVPATLETFLLVLRDLPRECDRNRFRLTIARRQGREYLFQQEVVWSTNRPSVAFDVPVATLKAAGGRKFVAKLFAPGNPEPVLKRQFKLVAPEEDG